jgi:hypothetical protein
MIPARASKYQGDRGGETEVVDPDRSRRIQPNRAGTLTDGCGTAIDQRDSVHRMLPQPGGGSAHRGDGMTGRQVADEKIVRTPELPRECLPCGALHADRAPDTATFHSGRR